MDNKKVNDPKQNPNSSETFKSTDIYASKASNQADYFAHVQPTFQDKLRAKAKADKAARAAKAQERAAKAQDPAFQKRRRKIIIIALSAAIIIIAAILIILIFSHGNGDDNNTTEDVTTSSNDGQIAAEQRSIEAQAEADRILANNPNNMDAVVEYYVKYTNQVTEQNDDNLASTYNLTMQGYQYFVQNNNPQAALSFLKQVDITVFDGFTQHWFYSRMVELAEQVGDEAARSKYSTLAEQTQSAYDARVHAAEQDVQHDVDQGYITGEDT